MKWKKWAPFVLLVILCCIPIFLTFNKGINYFDEGYILEGARRIVAGEVPYRDFHFIYTPGTIYFLAFFLRLGGHHIIIERLAAALISVVGIIFLGLLTKKITKNSLLVFLTMLLYAVWGPAHINFVWPVMMVLPFLFLYLCLLYDSHLFFAGVVAGIILFCKQNFGVALIVSFLCSLISIRYTKRQVTRVFLGFISVMVLFIIYLLATQSLFPFLADMNTYTIQEIVVRKAFSVPFPTQSIIKFLLYIFPGILSLTVGVGIVVKKKIKTFFIIPLTLFFVYLFGIFPTSDWTHLTPLLSITGILFVLVIPIFGVQYRTISFIFMIIFIGAGIYSVVARNYYRWEAPLVKHTHCFTSGVMKYMCIDEKNYAVLSQTLSIIDKEAAEDTSIFAFYNNPLYYFLSQKNNPTRFIDFNLPVGEKEEQKVISALQQNKVNIIITRFPPQNSQSRIIGEYIERNYTSTKSVYEFTVWRKAKK